MMVSAIKYKNNFAILTYPLKPIDTDKAYCFIKLPSKLM